MTVEETVAKAKLIIKLADEKGYDEYDSAVVEQFGEFLRGEISLEKVNEALDDWYETICE